MNHVQALAWWVRGEVDCMFHPHYGVDVVVKNALRPKARIGLTIFVLLDIRATHEVAHAHEFLKILPELS